MHPQNSKTEKIWRLIDILNWGKKYFKEKSFDNPRIEIESLLQHIIGCKKIDLYLQFEKTVTPEDLIILRGLIKRRVNREPTQYIIGSSEFYGRKFFVNQDVLIPRPETETIMELVLNSFDQQSIKILDAGTGSGAIALALASERKNWLIYALEKSENSIKIAIDNMNNLGLRVGFFRSNWLDAIQSSSLDVVVSNPPYIAANDPRLKADGVSKEPIEALVSKDQGFADLNKIIKRK